MICVASVCVGDRYPAEWVVKLNRMVSRHLPVEHEFACITEKDIPGVRCIKPEPGLPGWWQKVALFKPERFYGEVLYFDLDVIITGSLDFLVDLKDKSKLGVRDDFSYSVKNPTKHNNLLGYKGAVNSSVMRWRGDACRAIWDEFTPHKMDEVHGDQNWITQCLHPKGMIDFLPEDKILSYKYHIRRGHKPTNVVVFHGEPKPSGLSKDDPLRRAWEGD